MASKLYVGGLSYATTSESLREYFAQCGTVESAAVVTDRFSGESRGFGVGGKRCSMEHRQNDGCGSGSNGEEGGEPRVLLHGGTMDGVVVERFGALR